jgi:hypothetical protein
MNVMKGKLVMVLFPEPPILEQEFPVEIDGIPVMVHPESRDEVK